MRNPWKIEYTYTWVGLTEEIIVQNMQEHSY